MCRESLLKRGENEDEEANGGGGEEEGGGEESEESSRGGHGYGFLKTDVLRTSLKVNL